MRAGGRARCHPDPPDEGNAPDGHSGPRERARRIARPPARAALVTATAVGAVLTLTPASGAASDIATGFARAVRHRPPPRSTASRSPARRRSGPCSPHPRAGWAAISARRAGRQSGTASGDHRRALRHQRLGHHRLRPRLRPRLDAVRACGRSPRSTSTRPGTPRPTRTTTSPSCGSATRSSPRSKTKPERTSSSPARPPSAQLVQAIGYPNGTQQAVTCQNPAPREPMRDQLEFDCGGYPDGTSGGPFLSDVDPSHRAGPADRRHRRVRAGRQHAPGLVLGRARQPTPPPCTRRPWQAARGHWNLRCTADGKSASRG